VNERSVLYCTTDVPASFVVQVISAELNVMAATVTAEMVGAVVSGAAKVVKVRSDEAASLPDPSTLRTR